MAGIPLPTALAGQSTRRVIEIDSALLYLITGALLPLCDGREQLSQTGTLTAEQAAGALSDMFEDLKVPLQLDYWRLLPVGTILSAVRSLNFGSNFGKLLLCDGTVYNTADYPELGALLGSGLEVFPVPDLRGKFLRGQKVGEQLLATGGAETVALTLAQIPSHSHTLSARTSGQEAAGYGLPASAAFTDRPLVQTGADPRQTTLPAGSGQAHNNLPPYAAIQFWIVARND